MKAWWGDAATADNHWGYDYLPKLDKPYDMLQVFETDAARARSTATSARASTRSPRCAEQGEDDATLAKLKFLVIMDPLATETSEFWRNFGEHNDVDPREDRRPRCSACRPPASPKKTARWSTPDAGCSGTGRRRSRRAKRAADLEIMAELVHAPAHAVTERGRRVSPTRSLKLSWPYANPHSPTAEEIAREYSGKALEGPRRSEGSRPRSCARPASSSPASLNCATTAAPRAAAGSSAASWTQAGNLMARRDNSDPTGIGQTLNWAWAWPANRRVLYNRASCDASGKAVQSDAQARSAGTAPHGAARTCPTSRRDENPANGMGPFIMNAEGVARFFARADMAEGPFPEHYEPFETPLGYNPLNPNKPQATSNPAARVLRRRPSGIRQGRAVSACGHDLSPHRALPLLDQARAAECDRPTRAVRRDRRSAGQGDQRRRRAIACGSRRIAASSRRWPSSPSASSH